LAAACGAVADPEYQLKVAWPHLPLARYNSAKESEMVTLSESQRQMLKALSGKPVPVMDDETQQLYYLISADQFEQIRTLFTEEPFEPRELYPQISKTASDAGWSDPQMDDYDRYDELRPKT
jgi:hypothetical protein